MGGDRHSPRLPQLGSMRRVRRVQLRRRVPLQRAQRQAQTQYSTVCDGELVDNELGGMRGGGGLLRAFEGLMRALSSEACCNQPAARSARSRPLWQQLSSAPRRAATAPTAPTEGERRAATAPTEGELQHGEQQHRPPRASCRAATAPTEGESAARRAATAPTEGELQCSEDGRLMRHAAQRASCSAARMAAMRRAAQRR